MAVKYDKPIPGWHSDVPGKVGAIPTAVVMLGRMLCCHEKDEETFAREMATDNSSELYPLHAVEIAPFLCLSLLHHVAPSHLLHGWADAA